MKASGKKALFSGPNDDLTLAISNPLGPRRVFRDAILYDAYDT